MLHGCIYNREYVAYYCHQPVKHLLVPALLPSSWGRFLPRLKIAYNARVVKLGQCTDFSLHFISRLLTVKQAEKRLNYVLNTILTCTGCIF